MIETDETTHWDLNQAVGLFPGAPSRQTVWRWATRGVASPGGPIRLRTITVGRRRFTTPAWVEAFVAACTEAGSLPARTASTPPARRQRHREAVDRLKEAGL